MVTFRQLIITPSTLTKVCYDMALASNIMYTANYGGHLGTTGAEMSQFAGI